MISDDGTDMSVQVLHWLRRINVDIKDKEYLDFLSVMHQGQSHSRGQAKGNHQASCDRIQKPQEDEKSETVLIMICCYHKI